jgi:pyruvate kinase
MVVENLPGDSDEALQVIQERLLADEVVERGANIVMLAGQPFFARGSTNFIKVERIG